jgi:hypothetical protein
MGSRASTLGRRPRTGRTRANSLQAFGVKDPPPGGLSVILETVFPDLYLDDVMFPSLVCQLQNCGLLSSRYTGV